MELAFEVIRLNEYKGVKFFQQPSSIFRCLVDDGCRDSFDQSCVNAVQRVTLLMRQTVITVKQEVSCRRPNNCQDVSRVYHKFLNLLTLASIRVSSGRSIPSSHWQAEPGLHQQSSQKPL